MKNNTPVFGIDNLEICLEDQLYTTKYKDFVLNSAFQPIISIPHKKAVGFEALIRPETSEGFPVSPPALFNAAETSSDSLALDRVCRNLHSHNFGFQDTKDKWLFINLDSSSICTNQADAELMIDLFESSQLKPSQIVVEILESAVDDRTYLLSFVQKLKQLGCLIAIDDFGAGHSNFDRIWELEPDIVKIDRCLVVQAGLSNRVKRVLNSMVSLIHGAGSLVVLEGIETHEQALLTIEVGADMVQGFYFSKPDPFINDSPQLDQLMTQLLNEQRMKAKQQSLVLDHDFRRFNTYFERAITRFIDGESFTNSVQNLFDEPKAIRCYLLDEYGLQIGKAIHTPNFVLNTEIRFKPLANSSNANWSQKHYHYRAMRNPGKTQVTSPYLSLTGSHMCITVSKAVEILGTPYVICCDLDWQDSD
jgi:EAL domain-containing protein (putative c-di-GMP-specific phosphodiesterase class I)